MSTAVHKARVLSSSGSQEVALKDLPGVLAGLSAPAVEITWVHCEPDAGVAQALEGMGLDEIGVRSLRDGPERPRVEEFPDHLYVSLFSADNALQKRGRRQAAPAGQTAENAPD